MTKMRSVLSIAGSDSSGGAGLQADIKTITAHKLFAQTAVTALTAQNTMGVTGVVNVEPDFVEVQIDAVFDDIRPDAVKIGMVSSAEIVAAIARALKRHGAQNIVVDPVMVATSGDSLALDGTADAIREQLFPLAAVITPNMPEAAALSGMAVVTVDDQEAAAKALLDTGTAAVLVKGGHGEGEACDVLALADGTVRHFSVPRVNTHNTHGTGCTLSSAIACGLACDMPLRDAVVQAKIYITGALKAELGLGRGNGPVNHMWQYPSL